jgi:hypothetical protein
MTAINGMRDVSKQLQELIKYFAKFTTCDVEEASTGAPE